VALDVLNSPALPLLIQLEADGFEVAAVDDRLLVKPIDRLAPEVRAQLATFRRELVTLVRICDTGVQSRRAAFQVQLQAGISLGRLALSPDLPYVAGTCFSCGDGLPRPVFGRCWRCALAWRLAMGVPITPMVGDVYDRQRVVA
jgi:hypothetical protein